MSSEEKAYFSIRRLILNQEHDAGHKLKYNQLSKMLKMSKTPIVRALSRLKEEGLVEHKQNSGYKIAKIEDKDLVTKPSLDEKIRYQSAGDQHELYSEPGASLDQAVYHAIKDSILNSEFFSGQKLVYSDLEEKLGVSKTPIINALSRLESEGFVYRRRNVGYFVKEFDLKEVQDLFQAREALEIANVDFIMNNCTTADLVKLEQKHTDFLRYSPSRYDDVRIKLNRIFHLCLAEIGRNSIMIKNIREMYDLFDYELKVSFEFLPPERVREVNVEHQNILEALQARDKARLKRALRKHLKSPVDDIIRFSKFQENQA